jgi:hypothetical protein
MTPESNKSVNSLLNQLNEQLTQNANLLTTINLAPNEIRGEVIASMSLSKTNHVQPQFNPSFHRLFSMLKNALKLVKMWASKNFKTG